ncbi:MAG: VOC family protein [Alphaproteobacteria bacterium]|nr:VOC family protein [Alphaproteobacteria bacterium]
MIAYVTLGADDIPLAETFYAAFLPRLGYRLEVSSEGLSCTLPPETGQPYGPVDLYIKPPYDQRAASNGNGTMVAFRANGQALVRELHAAALANGGRNEGSPGFRAEYSANFYVGYLRDPQGNKIALFCDSRDEPERPD